MVSYSPKKNEQEVLSFWAKKKIPEQIVKFSFKKPKFYLLDGPPYVNDIPHVGHVKTTTFKDVWGKFKFMQGFAVWFQPGFDCSGLPIENAVEKKLGIKTKKDIERIGVKKFITACKKLAEQNKPAWMGLYKKLAAWRGWLDPYLTYKPYYLESGWWTIEKLYKKGLLVEGFKPGFWCPHCETVLAGYEVTDSYKNMKDPSIFIKFPIKKQKGEFLLVWTTTPWTLPANVAICIHPDEKYVKVEVGKEKLILAEKRLKVLEELEIGYKILEKFSGKKLEGIKYEPVLKIPLQSELEKVKTAHQVLCSVPIMLKRVAAKTLVKKDISEKEEFGHIVDMETGSGLVHIAPGHGDVDNKLGKHYNLPEPSPVDSTGQLTKETGQFSGLFVKKADPVIIKQLQSSGYLLWAGSIIHSYPLCWRCKSPLIYRMSHQWFLKIDTVKKGMIGENKFVNWLPGFAKERFNNVLVDAPDWAITRQRYWGIPLPIWTCKKCGSKTVIGSKKELRQAATKKLPQDIDLHKDVVDKIELKCKCGGRMVRVPDIMDVWFDSGIAPWASLGYPFCNKTLFKRLWPVDLIDESQDQVRGWFYSLMFSGFTTFGSKPYHTVCLNGWTLDEKGEKMSKSIGNVTWAQDAYNELGADLLRLYYCCVVAPWETQKFSLKSAKELGKVLNVLWNTAEFIKTYARGAKRGTPLLEDAWILSKINSLTRTVTVDLTKFRFHYASRALVDFILNDFSRWYIKIIRNRVSPWYTGRDKPAAQFSLLYILERLLKLLAPITPFITEKIYQDMFKTKDSVHLCAWPKANKKLIDQKLEYQMEAARKIIEGMAAARQAGKIKLRWPVKDVQLVVKDNATAKAVSNLSSIIKSMGNVKEIRLVKKLPKASPFELGKLALGPVLYEDALIRELIRKTQLLRKSSNLDVHDKISLYLKSDSKTEKLIKKMQSDILAGVGAKRIKLGQIKAKKGDLKFKEKRIDIGFEKL